MEKKKPEGSEVSEYYLTQKDGSGKTSEQVIEQSVMLPMRDGTRLATDIYMPADCEGKLPVLIVRSPYNKSGARRQSIYLAQHGYVVLAQDFRGRYGSEGIFHPFSDYSDGCDTIEWAASQPWSSGSVGTFGASALGAVQLGTALLSPPHLKAMFVEVACANMYKDLHYTGGAFKQMGVQGWMNAMNMLQIQRLRPEAEAIEALETMTRMLNEQIEYLQEMHTPLKDFPYLTCELMPAYQDILRLEILNPEDPAYPWLDENNIFNKLDRITVPIYHVGGFMDLFATATQDAFSALQTCGGTGAKGNQKLLMGPWTHATYGRGGEDTPWDANAQVALNDLMVRWFDYWLKGIDNGIMDEPAVRYYITGKNEWETAHDWPLPQADYVPFYLRSQRSGTVQSLNDSSLSYQPPAGEEPDTYRYDPLQPVPTIGGNNGAKPPIISGPQEQSIVEKMVLTYTTEPFDEDTVLAGPVQVKLYAASSAVDTDFTVKLTEVDVSGRSVNLTDSIVRAKFREGQEQAKLLSPGEICEFQFSQMSVSHLVKKGRRLRLQVASSNYPKFNRNLNNGQSVADGLNADAVVAVNTIYHNEAFPSHILLPIVKRDKG